MSLVSTSTNDPVLGAAADLAPAEERQGHVEAFPLPLSNAGIARQIARLSVWPFLEQLLAYGVSFVDTAVAARLSVEATNALSVAVMLALLILMLEMALAVGATALIARATGARHRGLANAVLGQALILAGASGAVMGAVLFVLAEPVGRLAGLTGESLRLCVEYLHILSMAAPLSAMLFVGSASLRGAGDTRSPFWVMVAVNLIHTALSVLLVFGPKPVGGHGLAGVAVSSVLAWLVGAVLILSLLMSGRGGIQLHWRRLRPHGHTARRLVRLSLPALLEFTGNWLGNFLCFSCVALVGVSAAWGAQGIAMQLRTGSVVFGSALATAAAVLAGQCMGMGDPAMARRAVNLCCLFASIAMGLLGALLFIYAEPLVHLVTTNEELVRLTVPMLEIVAPVECFFAACLVYAEALRGVGDTRTIMGLTYFFTFAVRLPAVYVLGIVMGYGLNGIWLALAAEIVVRGSFYAWWFWRGKWMAVRV